MLGLLGTLFNFFRSNPQTIYVIVRVFDFLIDFFASAEQKLNDEIADTFANLENFVSELQKIKSSLPDGTDEKLLVTEALQRVETTKKLLLSISSRIEGYAYLIETDLEKVEEMEKELERKK